MSKGRGLGIVTVAALAALLFAALATGPALAGKGTGNGNGNHSSAVLWTEPHNPYPAYGFEVDIMGSGFSPNSVVYVSQSPNGAAYSVLADGEGDIWFAWTTGAPGTFTFSAYQDLKGNHWSTYASVTVEVVE